MMEMFLLNEKLAWIFN